MVKTTDIIMLLEKFAPLKTAQEWDNSGWQINLNQEETKKIMVTLTVTKDVVSQAIAQNCDMIISHHPVFFDCQLKIDTDFVIDAIKNNIQIYSMHTNLDVASDGTTDLFIYKLGYENSEIYNEFVKYVTLPEEVDLAGIVEHTKQKLGSKTIKLVNAMNKSKIKTIAFCAGSGGSFISELKNTAIDLLITGDVKYHDAIDANDLVILDVGHHDSEKYVAELFIKILEQLNVEVIAANEKDIWQFV